MKERKIIILVVTIAIIISGILIGLLLFFTNNNDEQTSTNGGDTDSLNDVVDTIAEEDDEEQETPSDNGRLTEMSEEEKEFQQAITASDNKLQDARAADPIYKYLQSPYRTNDYTLALSINEKLKPVLTILAHTSEPATAHERTVVRQYEEDALKKIRSWGFDPNNYTIYIKYRY